MQNKTFKLGEDTEITLAPIGMRAMIQVSTRCIKLFSPLTKVLEESNEDTNGTDDSQKIGGVSFSVIGKVIANVIGELEPLEVMEIFYYLTKGCTCETKGVGFFRIENEDDLDKIVGTNIVEYGVFILEALRYNKFPFLNKVQIDFSSAIEKINTIAEGLTSEKK